MTQCQQWEYCELILFNSEEKEKWIIRDKVPKKLYHLVLRYFGEQGGQVVLSEIGGEAPKAWSYDPWERAMGLLGIAGWELVTIQHGNYTYTSIPTISHSNVVAYFKRPVLAGRGIREPEIVLP